MSRSKRGGLTLVELLVVIAIIAILIALAVPSTRRVRDTAALVQCSNNLKNVMLALHGYADDNKPAPLPTSFPDAPSGKYFPPGCLGAGTKPEERLSWMVGLLPYLDQQPLSKQFDLTKGYADNLQPAQTAPFMFLCPEANDKGDKRDPVTSYIAMAGIGTHAAGQPAETKGNGFMGYDRLTSLKLIKDGASNTIALMETRSDIGPWARGGASTLRGFDPAVPLQGDRPPFGGHEKRRGMNVAMADCTVRFVLSSIDPDILAAAITIADGDHAELPD